MKKTIAAILVTILASAGYIVLDKSAVEKIDMLASQVSSQQEIIDNYIEPADPLEMQTGSTLRCYPAEGTVVQAYVFDPSRTTTCSTTTTTTTTTTTGSIPYIEPPSTTTQVVYGQADEPTGTTAPTITSPTMPEGTTYAPTNPGGTTTPSGPTTTTWVGTTAPGGTTVPTTITTTMHPEPTTPTIAATTYPYFYYDTYLNYYYPLRTDVQIIRFRCEMIDKTLTGIPKYRISFSGKVDPSFAGRQVTARFDDSQFSAYRATDVIQSDGSFIVFADAVLANSTVIPLREVRIF